MSRAPTAVRRAVSGVRVALAAVALAAALPARAEYDGMQESPRWGSFELSLGGWRPRIDQEFNGAATPWGDAFGPSRALVFRVDAAKMVYEGYGTVYVGFGAGYGEKYGKGYYPADLGGGPSGDSTAFKVIPARLTATYRFDYLSNQYRWFPIAPYARLSLDHYFWWTTNGAGNTSTAANGRTGRGGTNGWSASLGIALDLNAIDPGLGREMDRDTGINHTYLFVDFTHSWIKDFGSSTSWDLSDDRTFAISGGILFAF